MIRSACGLTALVALLLQGSSGGHLLLVEHTHCAEHGELVHAEAAHGHEARLAGTADQVAVRGMPSEASDAAHEHCALTAERRDALQAIAAAQLSPHVIELEAPRKSREAFVRFDAERFRVAPKNSPPA